MIVFVLLITSGSVVEFPEEQQLHCWRRGRMEALVLQYVDIIHTHLDSNGLPLE
jgi:hypothetical protein